MEPKSIDEYVDWVMSQKAELADVDPEVRDQLKQHLTERVEDQINAAVLAALPKDKLEEFDVLLDGNDIEAVQAFCHDNIADMDQLVADVLVKFRLAYTGV